MRLLADSYSPQELNKHGFQLYAEFRPDVPGWGAKGEVRCEKILEQRKQRAEAETKADPDAEGSGSGGVVKYEDGSGHGGSAPSGAENPDEPASKKPKTESGGMSLEEYEAMLDADDTFADVDLSSFAAPSDAQIGKGT